MHQSAKTYPCDQCDYSSNTSMTLRKHRAAQHEDISVLSSNSSNVTKEMKSLQQSTRENSVCKIMNEDISLLNTSGDNNKILQDIL